MRYRALQPSWRVTRPAVDLGELRPIEQNTAPAVGELPAEHPAVLAAGGGGATVRGAVGASGGDGGGMDGGEGAAGSGVIPELAGLMRYGRAMLTGMLQAWWKDWRRRSSGVSGCCEGKELWGIACGTRTVEVGGPLRVWVEAHGWEGRDLTPGEAGLWLARWREEQK